jgi:hypothetical protein
MKTKLLFIIILIAALSAACVPGTPAAQPTEVFPPTNTSVPVVPTKAPATAVPSAAPTEVVSTPTESVPTPLPIPVRLVVETANHDIMFVDPNITLEAGSNPAFGGLNPSGAVIGRTAYVYDFTTAPRIVAVDENGTHELSFIQNPTYGVAAWQGATDSESRLAWGTQLIVPTTPSSLQISAPDGSNLETLYTQEASDPAVQLVVQKFSADGKSLYFSREPVGLGGYILFTGASSLYKIDIASKQISELIPGNFPAGKAACLDAISGDELLVVTHCPDNGVNVVEISSGATSLITPPDGLTGFSVMGSARFSPDGRRVAFALAKRNPDAEQGWVAVSDGTQGSSKLILTSDSGSYYTVIGWLDSQTLLVQVSLVPGCEGCENKLLKVNVDGSNLTEVATGSFLALFDQR